MTKSSSRFTSSYYSRFNNTNRKLKGNYRRGISSTMSTSLNNKVLGSPPLYKIDTAKISLNNNENSNRTSQTKNQPSVSGEYVRQRPNKLVRADLFRDQKRTSRNSSVVMANGANKVFKSQIVNKQCAYFNKYGRCKDGNLCPYKHNPDHVEICKKWLKGVECSRKKCFRQHVLSAHVIPHCSHFAKGMCFKGSECRYTHVKVSKRAEYCKEFMIDGFCDAGEKCRKKHEWGEYKEPITLKNQITTKKQENNNKRVRKEVVTEIDPWKLTFIPITD